MTKSELLADLADRDWCESFVGKGDFIANPHEGIAEYEQSVLEVVGNVAIGRSVRYYVRDERTEREVAWYKRDEPVASITAKEV